MKAITVLPTIFVLLLSIQSPIAAAVDTNIRTITVSGEGIVSTKADRADIHMQTSTVNKSASAAKRTVDQVINNALAALDKSGLKKDQLVASSIRLLPSYDYDNRERIFSGYQATRDLKVNLNNLASLDKVLEAATTAGINNVLSIQLTTSREDELREKARELAIEDSKRKAGELATAYGAQLGNVHTIHYHGGPSPVFQQEMAAGAAMMRAQADQGGGQYLHDNVEVRDQVQVVFELLIPH